ncbi:MAG: hypothetical protein EP343_07080 [Deltaproteobacteria bacterium]|nr:MAG: hypothetical protein EP343_07080 [Deltaproteobacteria bacterium]
MRNVKSAILLNKQSFWRSCLFGLTLLAAFALMAPSADAACVWFKGQRKCTWAPQWSAGVGINVDWQNQPGRLRLQNCVIRPTTTSFLYVPNSNMDSIAKLNSKTGAIEWVYNVGAYAKARNFPRHKSHYDPSRTTVDLNGNVWVGLRGGYHVLGLSPTGKLLGAFHAGKMPRAMAIDRNNHIWAGAWMSQQMIKIVRDKDGTFKIDKTIKAPSGQAPICPYGATTDLHGNIWISSRCTSTAMQAVKIDFRTGAILARINIPQVYGIQGDRKGFLWVVSYKDPNSGKLWKIDIHTNKVVQSYPLNNCRGRGVAVDYKDQVWVACSQDSAGKESTNIMRLDIKTGQQRYFGDIGRMSIGVAMDAQGYVWSVSRNEGRAVKTRIIDGAKIGSFPTCDPTQQKPCLGGTCPKCVVKGAGTNAEPYSYSDMTGYQVIQPPPRPGSGSWSSVFDAKCSANFNAVTWTSMLPNNTKVMVRARSAATRSGLSSATWGSFVDSGKPLGVAQNRFVQIEFKVDSMDCVVVPSILSASLDYNYPAEVCDGKDNDCDGKVDGIQQNCTSACGNGTQTCSAGSWSACNAPQPQPEVCDGKDNDCDGYVDESLTQACRSACGSGTETCVGGQWKNCNAPQPQPEVCDGKDNDCDGSVDESLTQACRSACGVGVATCSAGSWVNCTAPQPQPEVCDGKDNDCDGQTDEGLTRACRSTCGAGVEACRAGSWVNCTAPKPSPEVCDGKDNDCDGAVDESLTRSCSSRCGQGQIVCKAGSWLPCNAPQPEREVCDGKDNDCDGKVDNNLRRACKNNCGSGVEYCSNGGWAGCTAPKPEREVCDGKDNDCNGQVDEGIRRPCRTACGSGYEVCSRGSWGSCTAPEPEREVCDGKDNNCNGQTDEGYQPQACQTDCGKGRTQCVGGKVVCSGPASRPETCNDKDDDCNGKVDDNVTRSCRSRCGEGTQTCSAGNWGICEPNKPCPGNNGNSGNGNGNNGGGNNNGNGAGNPNNTNGGNGGGGGNPKPGWACQATPDTPVLPIYAILFVVIVFFLRRLR